MSVLLAGAVQKLHGAAPAGDVTLAWDYPTNELSTNLTFNLYGTNNVAAPVSTWPRLLSVSGTNTIATVNIQPGQFFFVVTSSNLWGESPPSNVASVPPLPKPPVTRIQAVR